MFANRLVKNAKKEFDYFEFIKFLQTHIDSLYLVSKSCCENNLLAISSKVFTIYSCDFCHDNLSIQNNHTSLSKHCSDTVAINQANLHWRVLRIHCASKIPKREVARLRRSTVAHVGNCTFLTIRNSWIRSKSLTSYILLCRYSSRTKNSWKLWIFWKSVKVRYF